MIATPTKEIFCLEFLKGKAFLFRMNYDTRGGLKMGRGVVEGYRLAQAN
jgi:hypothetical protein